MFRIGVDGAWLGFQADGQNIQYAHQEGTGGPAEGATASIEGTTVTITGSGFTLTGDFEEEQRAAAEEYVEVFNHFSTPK
jgi:hypothetical protein